MIFAKHQAGIDRDWTQVHRDLRRAIENATTDIEKVLDADQVRRLPAWLAERHGPTPGHRIGEAH